VDYSDPALPPGTTAEKDRTGTAVAVKQFTDRGWESDVGFIRPDETAAPAVERLLRSTNYDCVVIGGGVRLPPRNLASIARRAALRSWHEAWTGDYPEGGYRVETRAWQQLSAATSRGECKANPVLHCPYVHSTLAFENEQIN